MASVTICTIPCLVRPMTETRLKFAQRVAQLRQLRALTQEELAHAAGVSSRTIFNIEKGIYSVTLDTVQDCSGPGHPAARPVRRLVLHAGTALPLPVSPPI